MRIPRQFSSQMLAARIRDSLGLVLLFGTIALALAACSTAWSDPQSAAWMTHVVGTVPATGF